MSRVCKPCGRILQYSAYIVPSYVWANNCSPAFGWVACLKFILLFRLGPELRSDRTKGFCDLGDCETIFFELTFSGPHFCRRSEESRGRYYSNALT